MFCSALCDLRSFPPPAAARGAILHGRTVFLVPPGATNRIRQVPVGSDAIGAMVLLLLPFLNLEGEKMTD